MQSKSGPATEATSTPSFVAAVEDFGTVFLEVDRRLGPDGHELTHDLFVVVVMLVRATARESGRSS